MKQLSIQHISKTLGMFIFLTFASVLLYGSKADAATTNVYTNVAVQKKNGTTNSMQVWQVPQHVTNVYTNTYQKKATKFIKKKKKKYKKKYKNNINKPLLVYNPYGTYSTSVYFYAKTKKKCYANCTIKSSGAVTINEDLKKSKAYSKKQEYLISNLVAGQENTVILRFYKKNGKLFKRIKFSITMPVDDDIPDMLDIEDGDSTESMSTGIFAIIGHDRYIKNDIYYYDNNGINRGKTPLVNYRADRLITVGSKLIFPYAYKKIAVVNRLGKVVKKYNLGSYKMHHDFLYDSDTKSLICLVSSSQKTTIEDDIISIRLSDGKVTLLADMEKLMPDVRSMAVWTEDSVNTYGGNELDWIHLNSLDLIDSGEIILSSREQSSLIKLSNIYDDPQVEYIIHGGTLYDTTSFKDKTLTKDGSFVAQSGQHTITVEKDDTLSDGQYYLYMYNNNYAYSWTLPFYDWGKYFPTAGNFVSDPYSYYYKYLVDEINGTYKLVQSIELPYSRLVSGVQHYKGHITYGSGFAHKYGEYDADGNLIRMYTYEAEKYSFRVTKYNFRGFFYQKKNWNK